MTVFYHLSALAAAYIVARLRWYIVHQQLSCCASFLLPHAAEPPVLVPVAPHLLTPKGWRGEGGPPLYSQPASQPASIHSDPGTACKRTSKIITCSHSHTDGNRTSTLYLSLSLSLYSITSVSKAKGVYALLRKRRVPHQRL